MAGEQSPAGHSLQKFVESLWAVRKRLDPRRCIPQHLASLIAVMEQEMNYLLHPRGAGAGKSDHKYVMFLHHKFISNNIHFALGNEGRERNLPAVTIVYE